MSLLWDELRSKAPGVLGRHSSLPSSAEVVMAPDGTTTLISRHFWHPLAWPCFRLFLGCSSAAPFPRPHARRPLSSANFLVLLDPVVLQMLSVPERRMSAPCTTWRPRSSSLPPTSQSHFFSLVFLGSWQKAELRSSRLLGPQMHPEGNLSPAQS